MIPQSSIKDWNLDVEQQYDPHPPSQPLTTSVEGWGGLDHTNMMYSPHMDPSTMAMAAMMTGVQVPSYPPPYYNSTHPYYHTPDFYPGGAGNTGDHYTGGYQGPVFTRGVTLNIDQKNKKSQIIALFLLMKYENANPWFCSKCSPSLAGKL